jgi:hypothetical protein
VALGVGPSLTLPISGGGVWNLDSSTGGLGRVSLTDDGSYASSLRAGPVASPGYQAMDGTGDGNG